MAKTTKEITETAETPELKGDLLVKTISVTYTRKMNPGNYSPKYAYESVEQGVTAWADLPDPVPASDITPYFNELETQVKDSVNAGLGDVVRSIIDKGKAVTLDMNAVYTAFLDTQIDEPDKDTINSRWSAFLAAAGMQAKEDFR